MNDWVLVITAWKGGAVIITSIRFNTRKAAEETAKWLRQADDVRCHLAYDPSKDDVVG